MKKLSLMVLVSCAVYTLPLNAQYYYYNDKYIENAVVFEAGAGFGVMNSITDLGGNKGAGSNFFNNPLWKTFKPGYGVYILANYLDKICLRLEASFGQVHGYDSILKKVRATTFGSYERNLSFKSKIAELQLALEVHPLMFRDFEDENPPLLSPYGVVGVGVFSFDPQAKLNGQWYSLHPLRTEGQGFREYPDRKPYQLTQLNITAGMGIKYQISPLLNARLEYIHRILNTDYLDDASNKDYIDPATFYKYLPAAKAAIAEKLADRRGEINPSDITTLNSQRGEPGSNDLYFTIQFKVGITLGRQRR